MTETTSDRLDRAARSQTAVTLGRQRFRFVFRRLEIVTADLPENGLQADPQAGEALLLGETGVEWRPAYGPRSTGRLESVFVPWSAIARIEGRACVVLEYRDLYDDEVESDSPAIDTDSEQWSPTFRSVATGEFFDQVLEAIEKEER